MIWLVRLLALLRRETPKPKEAVKEKRTVDQVRQEIVMRARGELGKSDPEPYHRESTNGAPPPYPKHWCQAFYFSMVKRCGVAEQAQCKSGLGAELVMRRASLPFPYTREPKPGDLAFFDKLQHHAVVDSADGNIVRVVNGNGRGGKVTESQHMVKDVKLFYSIGPAIEYALADGDEDRTQPDLRV